MPAISAGAAKRTTCQSGKFHGITARTTPSGAVADQGPGGTGDRYVGRVRALVGEQALRVGRVPAHRLGALGRLGTGRGDRLAHFEGHRAGDGVAVRVQQVGGPVQPDGTLLERGGAVLLEVVPAAVILRSVSSSPRAS
ncbi:hypothetical protein SMICM17S_00687 [Streptomyces microflavus]